MTKETPSKQDTLFSLLKPYSRLIVALTVLSILSNALTLWLPRLLSHGIDGFLQGSDLNTILWQFSIASFFIFVLVYLQGIVQTFASEKVARDLRKELSDSISSHSYAEVQAVTPAKLLTNLTSDIDSIKSFVSQAVVNLVSSFILITGGSVLLLSINWKLGLAVLVVLPVIGGTFFMILGRVRKLFLKTREIVDWLNKVINESILGSALIRVLNSQEREHEKFADANRNARDVSMRILKLFSAMIPVIGFASNIATLIILVVGGKFIIEGTMSLGEFASFNSYMVLLIFPILMVGFMSGIIAQAQASYQRVRAVTTAHHPKEDGSLTTPLKGSIQVDHLNLLFGEKSVLKDVSLQIEAGSKVAIIGPTAAGKTQLLNLLIGLIQPSSGTVQFDHHPLQDYQRESLYKQIGLVFQDSIVFNISLRENIAFNTDVKEEDVQKAIQTAELTDLIDELPEGLDTIVSERGTSLSGGQKQRVMLARALAIRPKILLLDDFTARVDTRTEEKILKNLAVHYPGITLVTVTQKIASVEAFDQIVVLMEGELVAQGTHAELIDTSPEYVQIFKSQQSTNTL